MSLVIEYNIDMTKPGWAVAAINMHIDGLERMRHTTSYPEELAWEIRVYEWMLKQTDVDETYRKYQEARFSEKTVRNKRDAVRVLGWRIS